MYENPYFGNPYLQQNQQRYGTPYQQPVQQMQAQQQPVYNQMQQVPQQIQQPQLIGHIVDGQETIQASDVPMNAPYALFPKNDLSEIYLKSWTANGTIQTIVFKPVQNQQTDNLPSTQSEMKIGLSDDATEAFMKRFDELGRKLDELENSMTNNQNGNYSFLDMLNVFSVILQMIGYDQDQKQTSNDDLLRALQRQDREYLEKIISNQNQILDILSKTNE